MKSISSEFNNIIHVIASQSSGHCDGHQQSIVTSSAECKMGEWDTGMMCEDYHFYRHWWIRYVVQEIKQYMRPRDELFMHSPECYFGVYFPCCCATRVINIKTTLTLADKQFATWVHTLYYIYCTSMITTQFTILFLLDCWWLFGIIGPCSLFFSADTFWCCLLRCFRHLIRASSFFDAFTEVQRNVWKWLTPYTFLNTHLIGLHPK